MWFCRRRWIWCLLYLDRWINKLINNDFLLRWNFGDCLRPCGVIVRAIQASNLLILNSGVQLFLSVDVLDPACIVQVSIDTRVENSLLHWWFLGVKNAFFVQLLSQVLLILVLRRFHKVLDLLRFGKTC